MFKRKLPYEGARFELVEVENTYAIHDKYTDEFLDFKSKQYWWPKTSGHFFDSCWTEDKSLALRYLCRLNI